MSNIEVIDIYEEGGWSMIVETICEMTGFRHRTLFCRPLGGVVQTVELGPS